MATPVKIKYGKNITTSKPTFEAGSIMLDTATNDLYYDNPDGGSTHTKIGPGTTHEHQASQVKFTDGQTFQQKLDNGSLKGPKGDSIKGDTGARGPAGPAISHLTIADPNGAIVDGAPITTLGGFGPNDFIKVTEGDKIIAFETSTQIQSNSNSVNWTYIKYSSGLTMCWTRHWLGKFPLEYKDYWSTWSTAICGSIPYPFLINNAKQFVSLEANTRSALLVPYNNHSDSDTGDFMIIYPEPVPEASYYAEIFVIGRWK